MYRYRHVCTNINQIMNMSWQYMLVETSTFQYIRGQSVLYVFKKSANRSWTRDLLHNSCSNYPYITGYGPWQRDISRVVVYVYIHYYWTWTTPCPCTCQWCLMTYRRRRSCSAAAAWHDFASARAPCAHSGPCAGWSSAASTYHDDYNSRFPSYDCAQGSHVSELGSCTRHKFDSTPLQNTIKLLLASNIRFLS
jgi:hypothetical protein